jgi:hypothetical protein
MTERKLEVASVSRYIKERVAASRPMSNKFYWSLS